MITDRNKLNFITACCWIGLLTTSGTITQATTTAAEATASVQQSNRGVGNGLQDGSVRTFSPRMDYNNEWRPVGRGDPLKNDPTYDYSPPALERVRYWADSKDEKDGKRKDNGAPTADNTGVRKVNGSKTDIMLLGVSSERIRGIVQTFGNAAKNSKGETPLLQPKYTSIRRSYYAHQIPTHLMPPPMQTISTAQSMKPSTSDYRQSIPSYMSGSTMGMSTHPKPYYSTAATSPWMHASSPVMQHHTQRMPAVYDSHHQESVNYLSYSRPSTISEFYSPNSIRPNQNSLKQNTTYRKPWLHELLQKEVIKPVKPTMSATKFLMGTTKPIYESMSPIGISTTYSPVSYVTTHTTTHSPKPSMISYTTSPIFKTSTMPTAPTSIRTVFSTTTQAPTTTSSRLLIPTTNNLAQRPTVAPMEMTTDSLFSHYNQPEKPLLGPMYLIIEGHSKVKKYGKNEIDLHQPKIVPIIPKREPVVRIADPNEKRGTIETFQVKHLHTKTLATTTMMPTAPTITKPTTVTTTEATRTIATTPKSTISNNNTINEPPSGMQGLLNLLDSSLGNIFEDEPLVVSKAPLSTNSMKDDNIYVTTLSTILKPVTKTNVKPAFQLQELDARVGNTANSITSIINDDDDDEPRVVTTELAPREVRQVFDYDQLPESRQKELINGSLEEEEDVWTVYDDDDVVDGAQDVVGDYEDDQLIKRLDKLVDDGEDVDDGQFEVFDLESDEEATDFGRAQAKTT